MTNSSRNHAILPVDAGISPHPAADLVHPGKHFPKPWLRATLAAVTLSLALSGCGVFCGGAGGSGGGFAGGCATGMRF
ncbi:hypothetical protein [Paraburkholderia aromaticivorans]|uniref:hypothetical protein n=1 Tax=Paraburkholderia aromaticivorans TaxID=2026199 RepID=UPI0014562264|nr:hypothetical protein [Paraburkholderia aromaticivorans]